MRLHMMATFGTERVPKSYPKRKYALVHTTASEWWLVMAPTANVARSLCKLWPKAASLPTGEKILAHNKRKA